MKKLAFLLLLAATPITALADEIPSAQSFYVDWKAKDPSDNGIRLCDDTYFDHAVLVVNVSSKDLPAIQKAIATQCPKFDVTDLIYISSYKESGYRFKLEGSWECRLELKQPKTGKIYSIDFSDAC